MASFDRTIARVTEHLRERAGLGGTTEEITAALGVHVNHTGGALAEMNKRGTVGWHKVASGMCHNRRRWYLPEFKPDTPPVMPAAPRKTAGNIKPQIIKLDRKQRAVGGIPEPVQCPAFVDTRFTFQPPPGWVGQITRDWQERRQQETQS